MQVNIVITLVGLALACILPGMIGFVKGMNESPGEIRAVFIFVAALSFFLLITTIIPYCVVVGQRVYVWDFIIMQFSISGIILIFIGVLMYLLYFKNRDYKFAIISSASFFTAPALCVLSWLIVEYLSDILRIDWVS